MSAKPTFKDYLELYLFDHAFLRVFYKNLRNIDGKLYRAVQPSPFDIKRYKKMGIKTIINLRGDSDVGFNNLEKYFCDKHGIKLEFFKLRSRELPDKETIFKLKDFFKNITYPALIHCKSGADRAGLCAAFYQMFTYNSLEKAQGELSLRYLHFRKGKTGILDYLFKRYKHEFETTKISFEDWIENEYDPRILQHDYKSSKLYDFFLDNILHRE